ncbi:hypothetical protein AB2M62_19475 [Sphingomonas sp. MMS12-HWE2-04]|uniref:hypothetical protein n=1 Tax=Sphingomonas sp. MMS12-HWE2-04 TaxID=3234199 RepID=UPI00384A7A31
MLPFALAALLSPAALAAQNAAGDREVALVPRNADQAALCTADRRWCVELVPAEGDGPPVPLVRAGDAATPADAPPSDSSEDETYAVWPRLILLKDGGFLAGVETRTSTSYSGGGGSATALGLFRVAADGQPGGKPVLEVPLRASLMIRACFDEKDMKQRRGACHDEYRFSGTLTLAGEAAGGLPGLAYVAEAEAYPRGVSRSADSTTMARLKQSDLVYARDPACSFSRHFRFDAAAGVFRPDTALPDCSDYTVP